MTKKNDAHWHGDGNFSQNPFSALAAAANASSDKYAQDKPEKKAPDKLPKVRSSRIERAGHAGKTVTVVTFHGNPDDTACTMWLKNAKKSLGIGGTVQNGHVILQGDQTSRISSI